MEHDSRGGSSETREEQNQILEEIQRRSLPGRSERRTSSEERWRAGGLQGRLADGGLEEGESRLRQRSATRGH